MNALRQVFDGRKPVDLGPDIAGVMPGARSAPICVRRSWLVRWMVVGLAPKPISATDLSGTEPPLDVGTGRFSSVDRSRRSVSDSETWIGTWRSESENLALFCSMSPSVAIRIVWLSAEW